MPNRHPLGGLTVQVLETSCSTLFGSFGKRLDMKDSNSATVHVHAEVGGLVCARMWRR